MNGKAVVAAYLFPNGMVMSFDENGEQVPEYQGRYEEVAGKLRIDFPNVGLSWGEKNWVKREPIITTGERTNS